MRWLLSVYLIFSICTTCHTSSVEPVKTDVTTRDIKNDPFDRHSRLIFTRHARCRMDCRHITSQEIQEILDNGTINYAKSEPKSRPDPRFALEGYTAEQQHLRIIIAPEKGKLIIITCIELGVEWSCQCN
jgi:hypothetical protein